MNRRSFLKASSLAGAGLVVAPHLAVASPATSSLNLKTKHLIFIVNGNGARKKEYYEDASISPNIHHLAREGFVFEEDHCDQVSSHRSGFTELLTGNQPQSSMPAYPTIPQYIRNAYGDEATRYWCLTPAASFRQWRYDTKDFAIHEGFSETTRPVSFTTQNIFPVEKERHKNPRQIVAEQFPNIGLTAPEKKRIEDFIAGLQASKGYNPSLKKPFIPRSPFVEEGQSLHLIPKIMQEFKPRVLIFQQVGHDTGHGGGGYSHRETGYDEYVKVARSTDEGVGNIIQWVKSDPYFRNNTAIVVRPEFGRDDEVDRYGELHHSQGYYYAQRVASIFWGPDFNQGVDRTTVISRLDTCPTLTRLFNVEATHAGGRVVPGLFKQFG